MTPLIALVGAAWAQSASHHYCSDHPLAPPRPPEATQACMCLRHPAPLDPYDNAWPDWYGDVTPPWAVQPEGCFNVTNRVAPLFLSYPIYYNELKTLLSNRAEVIAHEHSPLEHHWGAPIDTLMDAAEYGDAGGGGEIVHSGTVWQLYDDVGRVAGIDAGGRGNVIAFLGRHPTDWRLGDLFVVLDSGEFWVLPGPHSGTATWTPAP